MHKEGHDKAFPIFGNRKRKNRRDRERQIEERGFVDVMHPYGEPVTLDVIEREATDYIEETVKPAVRDWVSNKKEVFEYIKEPLTNQVRDDEVSVLTLAPMT